MTWLPCSTCGAQPRIRGCRQTPTGWMPFPSGTADALRRALRHRARPYCAVVLFFSGPPPHDAVDPWPAERGDRWGRDVFEWARRMPGPESVMAAAALHRHDVAPHIHVLAVPVFAGRLSWSRVSREAGKAPPARLGQHFPASGQGSYLFILDDLYQRVSVRYGLARRRPDDGSGLLPLMRSPKLVQVVLPHRSAPLVAVSRRVHRGWRSLRPGCSIRLLRPPMSDRRAHAGSHLAPGPRPLPCRSRPCASRNPCLLRAGLARPGHGIEPFPAGRRAQRAGLSRTLRVQGPAAPEPEAIVRCSQKRALVRMPF